jgi:hypothetical protein
MNEAARHLHRRAESLHGRRIYVGRQFNRHLLRARNHCGLRLDVDRLRENPSDSRIKRLTGFNIG